MADHFIIEDAYGRSVSCSDERWFGHILVFHPEMECSEEEVQQALKRPAWVAYDKEKNERENFYYKPAKLGRFVKVVVEYLIPDYGEVKSAFYTSNGKSGERLK